MELSFGQGFFVSPPSVVVSVTLTKHIFLGAEYLRMMRSFGLICTSIFSNPESTLRRERDYPCANGELDVFVALAWMMQRVFRVISCFCGGGAPIIWY